MSHHGQIEMDWADGTYSFRLGLKEIEAIESRFDKSIFVIVEALTMRTAKSTEIFHVIREGLIGGGLKPVEAMDLVRRYVDARPLDESRDVAYAISLASLMRVNGAALEEPQDAPKTEATSRND